MLNLNVICWIPVLLVARLVVQMVKVGHVVEHGEDLSVRTAIKSKLNMHLITIKHESGFQSFTKDLHTLNKAMLISNLNLIMEYFSVIEIQGEVVVDISKHVAFINYIYFCVGIFDAI